MSIDVHQKYMLQALALAGQGRLSVSPNPMVGCIIIKNGQQVGAGWHQQAGGPHAEIHALHTAGKAAHGATVYVTLEPCCHTGRTPPCTAALIAAGVHTVHVACTDPNPLVAGKGIAALRAAGIHVVTGCCEQPARTLNKIFFHFIQYRRPFVIAKWAMSLDGKTVTHPLDTRQISSAETNMHTHGLRRQVDAILIGAETVRQDNPQLTVRTAAGKTAAGRQPYRIVLAGARTLPQQSILLLGSLPGETWVVYPENIKTKREKKYKKTDSQYKTFYLPADPHTEKSNRIFLPALLDFLGTRGVTSLLVEGGMRVHESFFAANLVNEVVVSVSPLILGAATVHRKIHLQNMQHQVLGPDICLHAALA